jgi:menaquinone-dependent protoporphyrinogen oxidase
MPLQSLFDGRKEGRGELRGISRRDFLALSAGVVCVPLLYRTAAGASGRHTEPAFVESTCRKDGKMNSNVLVAYASRCGSTGGVADAIGQALCTTGASVDVRLVEHVRDLSPYQSVIVGSAVRMGRWLPEAIDFVKQHRDTLARMPTAYFVVCLTMKDDTPENRTKVLAYLDPVRKEAPQMQPANIGLFSGALDFSKLSFVYKSVMKAKGGPEGDFRNWAAVRAWASGVGPTLLTG